MIRLKKSPLKNRQNRLVVLDSCDNFFEKFNFEKLKNDMKVKDENDVGLYESINKENSYNLNGSTYKYVYKLLETRTLLDSAECKKQEIPRTSVSPSKNQSSKKNLLSEFQNTDKKDKIVFDDETLKDINNAVSKRVITKILELNRKKNRLAK